MNDVPGSCLVSSNIEQLLHSYGRILAFPSVNQGNLLLLGLASQSSPYLPLKPNPACSQFFFKLVRKLHQRCQAYKGNAHPLRQ